MPIADFFVLESAGLNSVSVPLLQVRLLVILLQNAEKKEERRERKRR